MSTRCLPAALTTGLVVAAGCSQFKPPPPGSQPAGAAAAQDPCQRLAMIEDGEDGDSQIAVRGGRGGYLYTFADTAGTSISPTSDDVRPAPGGADGSEYALHISGKLGESENPYAGVGFSFTDPKGPYDASRWKGLSFVARRGATSAQAVRLKLPDLATDPDGKVCTDCYNDFGVTFQVGEDWTRYEVAFADLAQEPDWGNPRPASVDAGKVYGVQWQIIGRGQEYDIWIDDVSFLGCP